MALSVQSVNFTVKYWVEPHNPNIDNIYVDGVSITYGSNSHKLLCSFKIVEQ